MRRLILIVVLLAWVVPAEAQVKLHCPEGDKWVASASVLPAGCSVVPVVLPSITVIPSNTGDQALKRARAAELDLEIQKSKRGDPVPQKSIRAQRPVVGPYPDQEPDIPANLKTGGTMVNPGGNGFAFVPYFLTLNGQVEQGPMPYTECVAAEERILKTLNGTDEAHERLRELHKFTAIKCVKSDGRELGGGLSR